MIRLHSNDTRLRKLVREIAAPAKVQAHRVTPGTMPVRAHAIVTTNAINSKIAGLGYRLGTGLIFVLPEASEALGEWLADRLDEKAELAGSDVADIGRLAKAEMAGGEQVSIL